MVNIPTDLLRTLVTVVDCHSFTKAAGALGITQPAVSAQIKRLHMLLGCDVLDRSRNDIKLTTQGELVVSHARRLLSLNDQIMHIGDAGPRPELMIRVGTPSDFVASRLPNALARFREDWPDIRFMVRTGYFSTMVRELHNGELDLLIDLSTKRPQDARHTWVKEVAWVRGLAKFDVERSVPLVTYGEHCVYHQIAVQSLRKAGLDWEDVFTGPSTVSLVNAVIGGLGVMPFGRQRASDFGMPVWEDGPLPQLPDLHAGIYVREGGARAIYEQLADEIADVLDADKSDRDPNSRSPISAHHAQLDAGRAQFTLRSAVGGR
jgi:DNA-binding transcriptional LysR family regulator